MNSCFYTVTPLDVGTTSLGKDHVLGDEYSPDDRMEFALISFLVRGCSKTVLVDLGPKSLGYTNEMFRRYGFFRTLPDGSTPDDIVQRRGNVFDHLARLGIQPAEVTDVVFTHLHADHHGMDDATDGGACEGFPNAVFHVSKKGWDFNVERRENGRWNSYLDWGFGDCMLRMQAEGRLLARDNAVIAPGLETVYLGGHSVCSQAVQIASSQGDVVIGGDDFYRYELLQNAVVARIHTSRERFIRTSGMLADLAIEGAVIVPAHDPAVLGSYYRYGDRWTAEAKRLSLAAGRGFRSRVPQRS